MKGHIRRSTKADKRKLAKKSYKSRKTHKGKKHLRKSRKGKKGGNNFLEQAQKSKPSDEQRLHEEKKDIEIQQKMMANMEKGKYLNPEEGTLLVSSHPNKGFMADDKYTHYDKITREKPVYVQNKPIKPKRPYNPNEKSRELVTATMQRDFTKDMEEAGGEMDYDDALSFGGKKKRKYRKTKKHLV